MSTTDTHLTIFPSPGSPERWVTKTDAAEHVGCTTRQIEKFVAAGMPSLKVGGMRRFRLTEVDDWLQDLDPGRAAA